MKNRMFINLKDGKIYLIFIGVLIAIIAYYQPILSFLSAIALAYFVYRYIIEIRKQKNEWTEYLASLSKEFDSVTKHAVFNMPFPLVMLKSDYTIYWYNTKFFEMLGKEDVLSKRIDQLVSNIDLEKLTKENTGTCIEVEYNDESYKVYHNIIQDKKSVANEGDTITLYWINNTEYKNLYEEFTDKKLVVCLAYIDNYDEVRSKTPEEIRPLVFAEIDNIINSFAGTCNGISRKYENDKYLIIFEEKYLNQVKERRFNILDNIREIDKGNIMSITLSMGVGTNGQTPKENYDYARAAIDIALGRGGDQAVVKEGNNLSFYGGKTKAIEKRNKVKSRVIAHALKQLIEQADEVFVMGHRNGDMDSFGASIGIMNAARQLDKDCYFILNDLNPSIQNIYNKLSKEQPELLEYIIRSEEAQDMVYESSLLVVVDNHKPSFTEAPDILDLTDQIVLIDHHRRGAEFIEEPVLTYLEPYASSTCELVTEILYYFEEKLNLTNFEANALLAGITVDTKNFTFQTGVRTFEAASILKRAGADTANVKQLFRDDYNVFLKKAEVIKKSKVVFDKVAISQLEAESESSVLIAAQSADELLNINDIEASFVLTYIDGKVHISGRSLGNLSVQLILEKLGGGGHLTSAGTQIKNVTMEEAEKLLINSIDEYLKEGEEK